MYRLTGRVEDAQRFCTALQRTISSYADTTFGFFSATLHRYASMLPAIVHTAYNHKATRIVSLACLVEDKWAEGSRSLVSPAEGTTTILRGNRSRTHSRLFAV